MWEGRTSYRDRQWRLRGGEGDTWCDRILSGRGIIDPQEREAFVNPSMKAVGLAKGMRDFATLADAIEQVLIEGGTIGILGDYDVDGATSSSILVRFLRAARIGLGQPAQQDPVHIPDRMTEGYGPNLPALQGLAAQGVKLIVCVDSGTTAFEPLNQAAAQGIRVAVIDHHAAEDVLPAAVALVNPNRRDEDPAMRATFGHLCAAGLAWLVCFAVQARLLQRGVQPVPNATQLMDLVALGTVADVAQLVGVNRAFVRHGLRTMEQGFNPGINALAEAAGRRPPFRAGHIGFDFGPRINAGGRIGDSMLGTTLLTTEDNGQAGEIAYHLDLLNKERRTMCDVATDEASAMVEAEMNNGNLPCIVVQSPTWHHGIVGIVAGRLVERFNRPAIVLGHEGVLGQEGHHLKGSARSIPGVDIGGLIIAARQQGILVKGGGHPAAGGCTLEADRFDDFRAFLNANCAGIAGSRVYDIDLVVTPRQITVERVHALAALEPYGQGNPQPLVAVTDTVVRNITVRKERHLQLDLQDGSGVMLKAMAFHAVGQRLGDALENSKGGRIDFLGEFTLNEWNGRTTAEFIVRDAMWIGDGQ